MDAAVFFDRDGVLIEDVHLLTKPHQVRLVNDAPSAVKALNKSGFQVIVISNQTVVARGLATEGDVEVVHDRVQQELVCSGGTKIDAFFYCPHHPNATLSEYRVNCQCRKPRPGLLLQAAAERRIDLPQSFMIGDRITDIAAGQAAGCKTILLQTGKHLDPPIESPDPIDPNMQPDFLCCSLTHAVEWIIGWEK